LKCLFASPCECLEAFAKHGEFFQNSETKINKPTHTTKTNTTGQKTNTYTNTTNNSKIENQGKSFPKQDTKWKVEMSERELGEKFWTHLKLKPTQPTQPNQAKPKKSQFFCIANHKALLDFARAN
jgi:hypothetical protein